MISGAANASTSGGSGGQRGALFTYALTDWSNQSGWGMKPPPVVPPCPPDIDSIAFGSLRAPCHGRQDGAAGSRKDGDAMNGGMGVYLPDDNERPEPHRCSCADRAPRGLLKKLQER